MESTRPNTHPRPAANTKEKKGEEERKHGTAVCPHCHVAFRVGVNPFGDTAYQCPQCKKWFSL